MTVSDDTQSSTFDPRAMLATWSNDSDEWVRSVVRSVITTGRALDRDQNEAAYALFRQEKSFDDRVLPAEAKLEYERLEEHAELPLALTKLSDVQDVNALLPGSVIEPHAGLTILYGENGTGKTGYSRIFKSLAGSRTADDILADITNSSAGTPSATIEYRLGEKTHSLAWKGEKGKIPFTRISIFDSPSVNFHVDEDLDYVYTPTSLALFNHVIASVKSVESLIIGDAKSLGGTAPSILSRFPRESRAYPFIETLGASSDLSALASMKYEEPQAEEKLARARTAVAALDANTIAPQIIIRQRLSRVMSQAVAATDTLNQFDYEQYNKHVHDEAELQFDYLIFRDELFAAADLPAEPEESWESFVRSGDEYRRHLEPLDAFDHERCLYCRQALSLDAAALVGKYREYLQDKINAELSRVRNELGKLVAPLQTIGISEVASYLGEQDTSGEDPTCRRDLEGLSDRFKVILEAVRSKDSMDTEAFEGLNDSQARLVTASTTMSDELSQLQQQAANRTNALTEKRHELNELAAGIELARSWPSLEKHVSDAKEAERLRTLVRKLPSINRQITELAKTASQNMINQNFEALFIQECKALRVRPLQLEFIGRQGRAQRRKMLGGGHRPSKVFSEGEQKVLAMADFLAEARLTGITAPVIFDDPVSSLDHRRIREVAARIASLTETTQVIVFTHDILFATSLLSLFEVSKACRYYQVTDDGGTGQVTPASGPRWDSLAQLRKQVDEIIASAEAESGEAREALIARGYALTRSWIEVFVEKTLLQGVSERYQPNLSVGKVKQIKLDALPGAFQAILPIFHDACRYIEAHSQPLATLGVRPTLTDLKQQWSELQDAASAHSKA